MIDCLKRHQVYARLPQSKQCGIGTLRSEDGDGRENVAEKVNSRPFNLHSEPFQSWIPKNHIQVQKEGGNFVFACVLSFVQREIRHFHVVVVQWGQRNLQKRAMHVQNCCFDYSTHCFCDVLIAVAVVGS